MRRRPNITSENDLKLAYKFTCFDTFVCSDLQHTSTNLEFRPIYDVIGRRQDFQDGVDTITAGGSRRSFAAAVAAGLDG